ncbi:MAG: hypothetical protein EA350_04385 [Gemmatimonadales bacterium]|nr:MAG: hypothetical protein EA350_04385 [Gemmatimonadales bacterium]
MALPTGPVATSARVPNVTRRTRAPPPLPGSSHRFPVLRRLRSLAHLLRTAGPGGTAFEILLRFWPRARVWFWLARSELDTGLFNGVPVTARLRLFLRGHRSSGYYYCEFHRRRDWQMYVSHIDSMWSLGQLNGSNRAILDDKLLFDQTLRDRGMGHLLPELHGVIEGGVLRSRGRTRGRTRGMTLSLGTLLREERSLILKPRDGRHGEGIRICTLDDTGPRVNGRPMPWEELEALPTGLDGVLVQELCAPGDYMNRIFPGAASTIRVLTIVPAGGKPRAIRGAQRIATAASAPLDNITRGGLPATIAMDSGELGAARNYSPRGLQEFTHHPDTGAPIQGVRIPGWPEIVSQLEEVVGRLPELQYVGWDLMVTAPGTFRIIEGNHLPGIQLMQLGDPLLADPAFRSFLDSHGLAQLVPGSS